MFALIVGLRKSQLDDSIETNGLYIIGVVAVWIITVAIRNFSKVVPVVPMVIEAAIVYKRKRSIRQESKYWLEKKNKKISCNCRKTWYNTSRDNYWDLIVPIRMSKNDELLTTEKPKMARRTCMHKSFCI
jgi:hypothetical protein